MKGEVAEGGEGNRQEKRMREIYSSFVAAAHTGPGGEGEGRGEGRNVAEFTHTTSHLPVPLSSFSSSAGARRGAPRSPLFSLFQVPSVNPRVRMRVLHTHVRRLRTYLHSPELSR